ncbi:MAG: DUF1640 domain-containing protein [Methylovulum sp.]|nr:DUF1640 domain-containing protein [Methylovulum sp.]
MSAITFDTHEFFNELKLAGFSEQQAETITRLQKAAVSSTLEQARHECDLDNLVTNKSLDNRLREVELRMDTRFLELENKLVKWGIGLALGQVAVIAALVKLL